MVNQVKLHSYRQAPQYKYGFEVLIVLPATCGPDEEGTNEEGVDDEEFLRRGGPSRRALQKPDEWSR